jgi:F0F1-type ATP synthase assembly protein I
MRQLFQATGLQLCLLLGFGKARLEIKRVAMAVSHTKLYRRND